VVLSHLFPNISSIVIPPNSFHRPKKGCVYRHFTQNSCRNLIKGVGIVCSAPHTIANTSPPLLLNESPWNITNQSTSEQIFIENTSLPRKVLGTRIYLFRLILTIIPVAYRDFKSHFFFSLHQNCLRGNLGVPLLMILRSICKEINIWMIRFSY